MHLPGRQIQGLLVLCGAMLLPGHALLAADAATAVATSTAVTLERENFEAQLADLETQFGPYHQSLLEPLQSLVALEQSQNDFERVAQLQNRQLQVMRTVLGFRNPELIPLLEAIVVNEIRLQHWEDISDHLEHMRYLVSENSEQGSPAMLSVIERQAYWHLARVTLDASDQRARNFMQARNYLSELSDLAEEIYDETSPELIPWLYKSAMNDYRLVELLNADDGIAGDTIDRLVREEGIAKLHSRGSARLGVSNPLDGARFIPVVEDGELVGEAYLRDGMNTINRIGEIAEMQGDLEAQAMAEIYAGDFQKVMGNGLALRKYRDAREKLLEAGVDPTKIEDFFSHPAIIPFPQFYPRLDDALAYQQGRLAGLEGTEVAADHLGQLVVWQEGLGSVPRPEAVSEILTVELEYDRVDATLSVSSSGAISSVKAIAAEPENPRVQRRAVRALRELRVRPAIVDGKAQRRRNVHIQYLVPATE